MQFSAASSKVFSSTKRVSSTKRAALVVVRSSEKNNPQSNQMGTSNSAPAMSASAPTFKELMGFSGLAPELINGRLAMLGFIAALGAELASNETVVQQFTESALLTSLAGFLFVAGSLYTFSQNKEPETIGPFTPSAELINGRAAMIGLFSLLAVEISKGSALF